MRVFVKDNPDDFIIVLEEGEDYIERNDRISIIQYLNQYETDFLESLTAMALTALESRNEEQIETTETNLNDFYVEMYLKYKRWLG